MRHNKYEYDAFISHAVEDKIPIANDLCAKLEAAGLKIWYSGKELGVGDSIEKTIQNGLNRSRYGIVIFSPTYLAKNWTIREFYTLLAKEIEEQKVILPVLYNITLDELKNKDLLMADRFAVNADKGMDFVVERLVKEIKKSNAAANTRRPWLSKIGFLLGLSLLANIVLLTKSTLFSAHPPRPSQEFRPVSDPNTFATTEQFLGKVQGILSGMNLCTCQGERGSSAGLHTGTPPEDIASMATDREAGGVKKMTMAVIFHMETDDKQTNKLNRETEEEPNTLTMREEDNPFIQVSQYSPPSGEHVSCLHTADLAE